MSQLGQKPKKIKILGNYPYTKIRGLLCLTVASKMTLVTLTIVAERFEEWIIGLQLSLGFF